MNERIRQLAEQAKKYALDAMVKITDKEQALKVYSETYDTKFAELIIKECIRLCDEVDLAGADDCIDRIKDNFGVDE